MTKPSIVFLDESTVDLGDLNLGLLKKQGTYKSFKLSSQKQTINRLKKADIAIANKVVFTREILEKLPDLKLICVAATGVNNVDLAAAKTNGVNVCNVKGYSTNSVAEHTFALLLHATHRIGEHHHASTVSKTWSSSPFFALLDYPFDEIKEKTLGIVGYGDIGKQVAKIAKAFGMKVLIAEIPGRKYKTNRTPLKTLLKKSDFITLHCPLSTHTHHLINQETLKNINPQSIILNLARGPIVNENDMAQALLNNKLKLYATDVTEIEPIKKDNPLLKPKLKNKVLITPHIAWASKKARQRLLDEIALNIEAFKKGKKRNRIV